MATTVIVAPGRARRRLSPSVRRAQLLDAASRAFASAGYAGTSITADADGFRVLWRHAAREPEFRAVADRCRAAAVACVRAGLSEWTPDDALDWAAPAVVGYEIEAILTWIEFGRPADDARFVRATRASLAAGVRAWAAD